MDALENILNRVSARTLAEPFPSKDEMDTVYKAALRAPDHAWLRTSSFIEVKGKGLDKLSDIFVNYGKSIPDISDVVLDKYKRIKGIITDGDLRRSISKLNLNEKATMIMKSKPVVATSDLLTVSYTHLRAHET